MNIYIDTETQGLNTRAFLYGCIIDEDGNVKTYNDRRDMEHDVYALAEQCKKNKKTLLIYQNENWRDAKKRAAEGSLQAQNLINQYTTGTRVGITTRQKVEKTIAEDRAQNLT